MSRLIFMILSGMPRTAASCPKEREWMTRFLSAGFIDSFRLLYPEKQEYTWWSYRFNSRAKNKGWRIDYCMVSEPVRPLLKRAYI